MKIFLRTLLILFVLFLTKHAYDVKSFPTETNLKQFSFVTKKEDIAFLTNVTKNERIIPINDDEYKEISIWDFIASEDGRTFILTHPDIYEMQLGLESINRAKICENSKQIDSVRDELSLKTIDCFCNNKDPIIHCLALASKVFFFFFYF